MSLTLWAIEAARKNKGQDIVPGSSRHITAEMQTNLQIAKNGITAFDDKLSACIEQLNEIIGGINSNSPDLIDKVSQMSLLNLDIKDEITMSNSTWLRTELIDSRPELKLETSERVLLSEKLTNEKLKSEKLTSERILSSERVLPSEKEPSEPLLPRGNADGGKKALKFPNSQKVEKEEAEFGFEKAEESSGHQVPSDELQSKQTHEVKPETKNGKTDTKSGKTDARLDDIALSPIHIPRTAPLTSPNVDLSFIPIAKSINPQKYSTTEPAGNGEFEGTGNGDYEKIRESVRERTRERDKLHDLRTETGVKAEAEEEESDTSFQAISTAIRKSFAGKLSMGQNTGQLPLHSDQKSDPNALHEAASKIQDTSTVDSANGSRVTSANMTRWERPTYAKRSSVFVALPDREPILYLNSRQSIKVKMEELAPKRDLALPQQGSMAEKLSKAVSESNGDDHVNESSNPVLAFDSFKSSKFGASVNSGEFVASSNTSYSTRSVNLAGSLNLRNTAQRAQARSKQTARKVTKPIEPKFKASSVKMSSIPKISPLKPRGRSRSPVSTKDVNRTTISSQRRFTSRTTESGSPIRREIPKTKLNPRAEKKIENHIVLKREDPSSVESSRSPTKYSYRTDAEKNSPTDYRAISPVLKQEPRSAQKSALPVSTKPTLPLTAKEKQFQNKFLTTTLNPENPPHFTTAKLQQRGPSPVKKSQPAASQKVTGGAVIDHNRKLPSMPLKFEPSSRPKHKISLAITHAQDHRENGAKGGTSPSEKLVNSPKKRERTLTDKLELSSRKSTKRYEPADIHVAPRKRAGGNAVPLPDAARGIFNDDRGKNKGKPNKPSVTPYKAPTLSRKSLANLGAPAASPQYGPNALPDIPSDDEALKKTKYLKSWAQTPQLLRAMKDTRDIDPVDVFGDVPLLKMDEVFESAASRQRGMASPGISP